MSIHYTIRQLKTFIEVAKLESISKAAEKLHVTQPAVSMQIKQLEDSFGLALFEAQGRNIALTAAGKDFLGYVLRAMASFKELEAAMAEHIGLQRGRIDLAIVSTAKYFVPMLMVQFSKRFPDIEVKLHIHNKEAVFGMLERSEVDLAISGRVPNDVDCKAVAFATNPQAFVAPPKHVLDKRKNIDYAELAQHPFVVRELGSGTRDALERLFAQHNQELAYSLEMPSNETIKQAVMAGMGLSFLSLRTIKHELNSKHLVLLNVMDTPIKGQWQVVHLRQKKLAPAVEAFRNFLIEDGERLIEEWA